MFTVDQVLAAQKSQFDTLFGLTSKAFAGVERLVELNITASKAALSEAAQSTQAAFGVKDAQEFMAMQAGLLQPMAEKTAAYSRHLYDIATSTGAEFKTAFEEQNAEGQKKFAALVETATKNAPAGSETAVAAMKNAVAAASSAFEQVQKAVKQATDTAEANFTAASANMVNTAKAVSKKR